MTLHYGNESWTRDMRSRQSRKSRRMGMSPPVMVHHIHIHLQWLASMVIRRVTGYIGAATMLLACTSLLSACAQVGASPQRRTVTSSETSTSTSELVVTTRPSTGCGKVPPVAAGTTAKESLEGTWSHPRVSSSPTGWIRTISAATAGTGISWSRKFGGSLRACDRVF